MIEHLVQNSPPMPDYSGHPVGERHQDCPICSAEGMTAQTNTLSDELVERLRAYRGGDTEWRALMDEAASGIERIQEEARKREEVLREVAFQLNGFPEILRATGYGPTGDAVQALLVKVRTALSADMGEDHDA